MGREAEGPGRDPGQPGARHRRALWVACMLGYAGCCAVWLLLATRYRETGWDFPQFYLAAHLPARDLYNRAAYLQRANELFQGTKVTYFPPYVRPAVFALPLAPLSLLSYKRAFVLWSAIQFACWLAHLALLRRLYPYRPEMLLAWGLFFPSMFGIITGQDNNALSLVVLVACLQLMAGRERLAGALFSLCLYKFNLFVLLPAYLAIARRWRALCYAGAGACVLAGASFLLQSPRVYLEHLRRIPEMTIMQGLIPTPGLRGLTLGWPAAYPVTAALAAAAAMLAMRRSKPLAGLAIALCGSVMIAYHVASYDLTVLTIPIAAAMQGRSRLARFASMALLAGAPLWLRAAQWAAPVMVLLFAGLLVSALGEEPAAAIDTRGRDEG